ncbi:hypothetical protein WJ97_12760 [Burkholderia ubonensis]|uniref:hypothetical protein n=1 Tax=Burkholderia ubonensis TaxID=101571 RepID=UPI000752672E|nr:hypothetical protein [Burkholderia ubonensis]KVP96744.1 hypothetical protein WJ97_12760 [Burkholderia ubonensis]
MKKNVVSIALDDHTPMSDRLEIKLDGVVHGVVDLGVVEEQESPVMPALIILGFTAVNLVDEAGRCTRYTTDDFLKSRPMFYAGALPSLGVITLTTRWSEPLEEYRLDVAFNGAPVKSVNAGMNLKTLREILVQLGFTVGHIEEFAQAA